MKYTDNLNVFDLIPPSIKSSKEVQALFAGLQSEVDEIITEIHKITYLQDLTTVDDILLDHIAATWGLDAEDGWGIVEIDPAITRAKKESFVKLSWDLHRYRGTKYALERIISFVGLSGVVESWWQYSAPPYHFRITITGATNYQPWQIDLLSKLVLKYQSVRDNGEIHVEFDYLKWYWAQSQHIVVVSESVFIIPKLNKYFANAPWLESRLEDSIPLNNITHKALKKYLSAKVLITSTSNKSTPLNNII